jgi:hypothetical protein
VIYVWKLPEEVSKILAKKKSLAVSELAPINEDEMEESLKATNKEGSFPKQAKFDNSANVKNELDGIFAQIG